MQKGQFTAQHFTKNSAAPKEKVKDYRNTQEKFESWASKSSIERKKLV